MIFTEPLVFSLTGIDHPLIANVDSDNQAEVIMAAFGGIRVFDYEDGWTDARPLWNQHSYHITNINEDISVPFSEPNSWDYHNTYRTQTTLRSPMPIHAVTLTHTVGIDEVQVLTDTFSTPPDLSMDPIYGWNYTQTWEDTYITRTFEIQLTNLQPGESRMGAQCTTVEYTLPSGKNLLTLPPLYASVPHITAIEPATQTVGAGGSAVFTVKLSNPGAVVANYELSLGGLPQEWGELQVSVPVPAGSEVNTLLTINVPPEAEHLPFNVSVHTDLGSGDQVGAMLNVMGPTLAVELSEPQTVATGESADFSLTVTNLENAARTYALRPEGLALVSMPPDISVGANSSKTIPISAQAVGEGSNPFTVFANETGSGTSSQDTSIVTGEGFQQVSVTVKPSTAPSGPGVPTLFAVTVTKLGSKVDTFDMSAAIPTGWSYALTLLSQPISAVTLASSGFNPVELQLLVTPPTSALEGNYNFTVTVQSQSTSRSSRVVALASDTADGIVQVGPVGVDVTILASASNLSLDGAGTWQAQVTNTGTQAETFDLNIFGPLASYAQISPAIVTLDPGESQTAQLTISGFDFSLAGDYLLGVHAQSQTLNYIQDEDTTKLSAPTQVGLSVAWQPSEQTISEIFSAAFTLVVTNTGNTFTSFDLILGATPVADVSTVSDSLPIPPLSSIAPLETVEVTRNGTYLITATAGSSLVQSSDTATLVVEGIDTLPTIYLPMVFSSPS